MVSWFVVNYSMSKLIASFKASSTNNLLGSQQIYKNVSIVRTAQEGKKNELEKKYGEKIIRQSVINPLVVEKENRKVFNERYKKIQEDTTEKSTDELRKFRNNLPYKAVLAHFLKEEDYKKIKEKEDLLIHKTTKLEKLADLDKLEKEYKEFNDLLEKHKGELKMIYSLSDEESYKKKFEYNRYSKQKIKYDPQDHNEAKQEKMEILKKEQEELETNTKMLDDILSSMTNLENDEREKYKKRQKKTTDP